MIQILPSRGESKIPIHQEVYQGDTSEDFMTVDEIEKSLEKYQPSKVGETRKDEYYRKGDLVNIAKLLKIDYTKMNKDVLAKEILINWRKKYPQHFENGI